MTTAEIADPFADAKSPSLSFKEKPVGTKYEIRITAAPNMAQTIDFNTNKPAFWANPDGTPGNPKMAAVFKGEIIDGPDCLGEIRSVWAPKPSSMFTAIAEAQQKFGRRIEVGGVIEIEFAKTEKNKNPKFNDQKIYSAEYVGPKQSAVEDPLGMEDFK
jgi:hypothetical protein